MLEWLIGYPVLLTVLVSAPRGIGTMIAMVVVAPMIKRVEARYLILAGLLLSAYSLYMMSGFSLGMDEMLINESGFLQGLGTRSEDRRVGTECDSTCSSRWSPWLQQKNLNQRHTYP